MIHPSYSELMQVINSETEDNDEAPVVSSRYSVVLATSKRARQIIAGEEPLVRAYGKKPLSIAVEEVYEGKVKILAASLEEEEETEVAEEVIEEVTEEVTSEETNSEETNSEETKEEEGQA